MLNITPKLLKIMVTPKSYALIPNDGRKSFYGKAVVHVLTDGTKVLQSYDTMVVEMGADGTLTKLWDGWTATTGRHIRAFCGLNKAEFDKLPLKR